MTNPISSSFFDKFFNPLSIGRADDDLVKFNYGRAEQACYFLASVILGTITLGTLHLLHEGLHHYWRNKKVTESNPDKLKVELQSKGPNEVTFTVIKETPGSRSPSTGSRSSPSTSPEPSPRLSPASPRHLTSLDIVDERVQCKLSQGKIDKISECLGKDIPRSADFKPMVFEMSDSLFEQVMDSMEEMQNDQFNTLGSQACAVICLKAVTSFFEKGLPKTDRDIYELIYDGISYYHEKQMKNQQVFSEIYEEVEDIKTIGPDIEDAEELKVQADIESFVELLVLRHEYQGNVNNLLNHLESIRKKAFNHPGRTCAVITTTTEAKDAKNANATLVIMIDENNNISLFDSHGSEGSGASLKFFKDANDLTMYIKKEFFTNKNDGEFLDGTFSIKVLNKQLP